MINSISSETKRKKDLVSSQGVSTHLNISTYVTFPQVVYVFALFMHNCFNTKFSSYHSFHCKCCNTRQISHLIISKLFLRVANKWKGFKKFQHNLQFTSFHTSQCNLMFWWGWSFWALSVIYMSSALVTKSEGFPTELTGVFFDSTVC